MGWLSRRKAGEDLLRPSYPDEVSPWQGFHTHPGLPNPSAVIETPAGVVGRARLDMFVKCTHDMVTNLDELLPPSARIMTDTSVHLVSLHEAMECRAKTLAHFCSTQLYDCTTHVVHQHEDHVWWFSFPSSCY